MGPLFLAGGFNPDRWEIRLYNEHSHGTLEDGISWHGRTYSFSPA